MTWQLHWTGTYVLGDWAEIDLLQVLSRDVILHILGLHFEPVRKNQEGQIYS